MRGWGDGGMRNGSCHPERAERVEGSALVLGVSNYGTRIRTVISRKRPDPLMLTAPLKLTADRSPLSARRWAQAGRSPRDGSWLAARGGGAGHYFPKHVTAFPAQCEPRLRGAAR